VHGVAEFVENENAYGRQVSSAFFLIPQAIAPRRKALESAEKWARKFTAHAHSVFKEILLAR